MRSRFLPAALLGLGILLGLHALAHAETKLTVDVGWGWRPRAERWAPVFITASSDKPRNVLLDIEWPGSGNYLMRIQQAMTLDVHKRTFPILLPMHGWEYQQAGFTLSDRDSGKTLAHFPDDSDQTITLGGAYPDASAPFVGVTGGATPLAALRYAAGNINIGFIEPRRIPTTALGFDDLDVLILNGPNLGLPGFGPPPLDDLQQQAIVDWVRTGGNVILWPGDGGLSASGPLADVLPAKVGGREDIALSPADASAIGLPDDFKNLANYHLEPRAGADRIPLFNAGQASAFGIRVGLGRIVLSPVNIGGLQIDELNHSRNLWRPLLKGIVSFPADAPPPATQPDSVEQNMPPSLKRGPHANYNGPTDKDAQRERTASTQIADFLGNVPDAGRVEFSSIAWALLGLMFVAGPVDWFVLKRIGRRPWTVTTIGGWAVLVISGAIFANHSFKPGDLRYKTLRTIDQVDDSTIAGTDYIGIYASRTPAQQINTDPASWWQPAPLDDSGASGLKLDIDFHQTRAGNTPQGVGMNVWSERFLRGDHVRGGPAMLTADLHAETAPDRGGSWRIVGTIRNLSDKPLKNIRVAARMGSNICTLSAASPATSQPTTPNEIAPQQAVSIEALLIEPTPQTTPEPGYGRFGYLIHPTAPNESDLWSVAANLNVRRANLMAEKIATGNFAIVYAETDGPAPPATLIGQPTLAGQHWQFIRALVELHNLAEK